MSVQVLLLQDVDKLGRKGQVVRVKSGYARNFLLPQKFGVVPSASTLKMQEKLQRERQEQAIVDEKESRQMAESLSDISLTAKVKVDPEGHLYGSVSPADIEHLLKSEHNIEISRKSIVMKHPIKTTGIHEVPLKFKEGVSCSLTVVVEPIDETES